MKHPAVVMRGTPTGGFLFMVTNKAGKIILTSSPYETEDAVVEAVADLVGDAKEAQGNVVDQLPSTIAHL